METVTNYKELSVLIFCAGYVSFDEFVTQLCSEAPEAKEEEEDIRQIFDVSILAVIARGVSCVCCFQVFDADGDGLVSFEELCNAMAEMGASPDTMAASLKPWFEKYDKDQNEGLDFEEFKQLAEQVLM